MTTGQMVVSQQTGSSEIVQAMGEKGAQALVRAMQMLPRDDGFKRRFQQNAVALFKDSTYAECTPVSKMQCIFDAARIGLQLNDRALGHCFAVPRNRKVGDRHWVKEVHCQIGYKGYVELALRSGFIKQAKAEVVYSNDDFSMNLAAIGSVPNHVPYYLRGSVEPGERIGAYCVWQLADDTYGFSFISEHEIQKIKRQAEKQGGAVWRSEWEDEMAKKSAVLRARKMWRLSPDDAARLDFADRIERDEYLDGEVVEDLPPAPLAEGTMRVGFGRGGKSLPAAQPKQDTGPEVVGDEPEYGGAPQQDAGEPDRAVDESPAEQPGGGEPEPEEAKPATTKRRKLDAGKKDEQPATEAARKPTIIKAELYHDASWWKQMEAEEDDAGMVLSELRGKLRETAEAAGLDNPEAVADSRLIEFIALKCAIGHGKIGTVMCKAIRPALDRINASTCEIELKI